MPEADGWHEGDWRYVCYPLGVLLQMLNIRNGEIDPLVDAGKGELGKHAIDGWATEADVYGAPHLGKFGRLGKGEFSALNEVGVTEKFLNEVVSVGTSSQTFARVHSAIPLRSIERIHFYSYSSGGRLQLSEPFSALETARAVDTSLGDVDSPPLAISEVKPVEGAGSRIVLIPDLAPGKPPGALVGFAVHLEVKIAVNGEMAAGDRRFVDPRLVIDAGVINSPPKGLWSLTHPNRGAVFDVLRMRCTIEKGKLSKGVKIKGGSKPRDLMRLAEEDGRDHIKPGFFNSYYINTIPVVDSLELPPIENSAKVERRYGFRVLSKMPDRIGWRFETTIQEYAGKFAGWAVKQLIPDWMDKDRKGLAKRVENKHLLLAEEQIVEDIEFPPKRAAECTSLTVGFVMDDQAKLDNTITEHVLNASNSNISLVHAGLKAVRDGRPLSLLPQLFMASKSGLAWDATGMVIDTDRRRLLSTDSSIARSASLITFEPSLLEDPWGIGCKNVKSLQVEAVLPLLGTTERTAPRFSAEISAPVESTGKNIKRGTSFAIRLKEFTPQPPVADPQAHRQLRRVLIGALEFTLGQSFKESLLESRGRLTLLPLDSAETSPIAQLSTAIDASIVVPIERVDPGGQDDSDRDVIVNARQRGLHDLSLGEPDESAPLLLPIIEPERADGAQVSLKLAAEEVVTRDRDHTLALALQSIEERGATVPASSSIGRVLVIDPRPFRIAAVDYQPIAATATSESNEVAVWNAEGEGGLSWRVRDDRQSVALELPPQVIGEAMEKNRSGLASLPSDIRPGRPSAVRFGSPTRIRVDPTFADTRLREPGWNLRRMLGNALQRLPGARLLDLRLELLYGLLTRVRSEGVQITEVAGAIGEPALPIFDTLATSSPHVRDHCHLVNAVLAVERFRLAADKLYRLRPDEYLRLAEGVSFKLRLRELDEQGVLSGGPATPLRWPTPSGIPTDTGGLVKLEVLARTFSASDHDEDSFPGGLAWAFESANVLMSVYGQPQSNGGSVGGVYLSAHGGYGSQRALFDNRKTVIETETTQGRVQRYRLERIGRIGCLWHQAKHVIVYERTVVPSAQFYNQEPIGLRQDEHAGRALPRKVEEYVELLQPKRHYPEDGTSVRASGCLLNAEFKSTKIRVDSAWGSDVRRDGWQVPLWNTDFESLPRDPNNPDDPANVYPKPQIRFTFAARDGECVAEVDEPAKLVFYTSVVPGEDDRTDLWKPVRDVDFCDVPKVAVGRVRTASDDLTDAMLPPEPEHEPGYERFTIGLVPCKNAAALAHGRVADGPQATLRNVTLARAVPLSTGPQGLAVPEFGRALAAKTADVRAELDRQVGRVVGALEQLDRATDPGTLRSEADRLIEAACRRLQLNVDAIKDPLGNVQNLAAKADCRVLSDRARAEVNGQLGRFSTTASELLKATAKGINEWLGGAGGGVEEELDRVADLAARAQALAVEVATAAANAEELRRRALDAARRLVEDAKERIKGLRGTGKKRIQDRIVAARMGLEDLRADIVATRDRTKADLAVVHTLLGATIQKGVEEVQAPLANLQTAVDDCIAKLQAAGGTVDTDSQNAAVAAQSRIGEARAKLAPLLKPGNGTAMLPGGVLRLLETIDGVLGKAASLAESLAAAKVGTAAAAPFLTLATRVKQSVDGAKKDLDDFLKNKILGGSNDALNEIQDALDGALDEGLKLAEKLLSDAEEAAELAIFPALAALSAAIDKAADDLTAELDKVKVPAAGPGPVVIPDDLDDQLSTFAVSVATLVGQARGKLGAAAVGVRSFRGQLTGDVDNAAMALTRTLDQLATTIGTHLDIVAADVATKCEQIVGNVTNLATDALAEINARIKAALDRDLFIQELEVKLKAAVAKATKTIAEVKAAVAAEAARVTRLAEARVRQVSASVQQTVQGVIGVDPADLAKRAEGIYQQGDSTLRLIRAVGNPPKTDNLGFNRPEVAYVFGEAKDLGIDMTPALALVNRAADQVVAVDRAGRAVGDLLDSFGIRLPVNKLTDQLIPEKLKNLSVSDLLPDMGGIDFKGLLQRVGFPDLDDSDAFKVRHGFDRTTRRTWMEADLNIPFAESVPLMSFGPVQIFIDTAKFESHARISAGGGGVERTMNGRIFGDWRVVCSGQTILTFRQTELRFDDSGKVDFSIQPERVELAETLRFITDLMKATGQKGGLRVEPLMRGGYPSGVAATLDMVLPPIQTGAFGVSDLSLHVQFGISAVPRFEIISELSVGSRLAPFSLNIWILNGGGYFIQKMSYLPTAKPMPLLIYTLDISIVAGLGLGVSFGVVSGGIWLQVGCGIALTWTTGMEGSTTALRVFLLARGNVDIAGLVTASISLLFEASYDGELMIGAGTLSISVKISAFFTIEVDEHVEYVFAGQKQQSLGSESGTEISQAFA